MTEIKMLPLPKWCYADKHLHVGSGAIRKEVRGYSSAVAKCNVAARDAEIKALRAEREVIVAEAVKYADKSGRLEAKAERLAEALRRAEGLLRSAGIIAESDLERPHSAATEIKNALRDHDQEDEK